MDHSVARAKCFAGGGFDRAKGWATYVGIDQRSGAAIVVYEASAGRGVRWWGHLACREGRP
jgi:hypothetical protein